MTAPRYLFGPFPPHFDPAGLDAARGRGECRTFHTGPGADLRVRPDAGWPDLLAGLPAGWVPDLLVLWAGYTHVPPGLWAAPVPVVGLAPDWNLLAHPYRALLPRCDRVLTDAPGVAVMRRAGLPHARPANLFGLAPAWLEEASTPAERDIGVLFVGNLHPAVQAERLPWLGRLARLSARHRVAIRTGVFGADYRALMRRAKLVFNRSIRGECNQRAFEAVAAGAVLLQEADNREVPGYLDPGAEYAPYTADDLEDVVDRLLGDPAEREAIVSRARAKLPGLTFAALWGRAVAGLAAEMDDLRVRAAARVTAPRPWTAADLAWAALGGEGTGRAAAYAAARPDDPFARAAAGAFAADPGAAADAAAGLDTPAGLLNRAEGLARAGRPAEAVGAAERGLTRAARSDGWGPGDTDLPRHPPGFDPYRVAWEAAGWGPGGGAGAKRELVRWRLHALLAGLTGELHHYHAAALLRPADGPTRAALGCALARAGRVADAVGHLRAAVEADPFDRAAARALGRALADLGDRAAAGELAAGQRALSAAAPDAAPAEDWFAAPPPRPRVSLSMIVRDEAHNLPECLRSAAGLFDEVVVVDTGSADDTRDVARAFGAVVADFPWADSFAAARNESLRLCTGEYVFWMDADDRLDDENRAALAALLAGLPAAGDVAYVSKCVCVPDGPGGTATAVDHVRLFPHRPGVRWDYRVHEQILPALRRAGVEVKWSGVTVRHVGYADPAVRRRKLDRDLRLLGMEAAERPADPFVRFNLGAVHHERGDDRAAEAELVRSLAGSHPRDSIVRKTYALLSQCRRRLGDVAGARAACRDGRAHYPDDAELLYLEAGLLREAGDAAGAEGLLRRLVGGREGDHFASVDAGLRGAKGRHALAALLLDGGRVGEAAAEWRAAVAADPGFAPGWAGLGEAAVRAGDGAGVAEADAALRGLGPGGAAEAAGLAGRWHLARGEWGAARAGLEEAVGRFPGSVPLRVLLTHALLKAGDEAAAGPALRAVLVLDPAHAEARHNLDVLLRRRAGAGDPPAATPPG